jgi:hypothetical protein
MAAEDAAGLAVLDDLACGGTGSSGGGGGGSGGGRASLPSLSTCYALLQSLLGAHLLEQVGGSGLRATSVASSRAASSSVGKNADLLQTGVRVRCLLGLKDVEVLASTIGVARRTSSGAAMEGGGATRMGDRFELSAWLTDRK